MSPISILTAVVLSAVLTGPGGAVDTKKVVLRWHGQSFCELISSKGTRVVFDPHAIEAYGRISVSADLVLVSHFHPDHMQVGVIENRAQAHIVAGLKQEGKKLEWNPVDEQFRDVHIRTVGVYHDNSEGMEGGKNAVFVVDVDGLHVVHLGDLGHLLTKEQVKAIGPVDVLLIPVGGVYTLNGGDAWHVIDQLRPRRSIIPIHYGTEVFDELLPLDEFLEDTHGLSVRRATSNELVIDPSEKAKEPTVVILKWK